MNENYIRNMRQLTFERLEALHDGATEISYTDFPDHGNVGDSAIALGQLEFYRSRNIVVKNISSCSTAPSFFSANVPVVIHGGGNLGDLYPHHQEFRIRLGRHHGGKIIQAPQSVHFRSKTGLSEFIQAYETSEDYRLGLRDDHSVLAVKGINAEVILSPDSFHCLGSITSAAPEKKVLILARTDSESGVLNPSADTRDWPRETGRLALGAKLRHGSRMVPSPLRGVGNLSPDNWQSIASHRFEVGVDVLSTAETIITDRLHAMLISLQMGRSVIAIDNNNRKLRNYAETWFGNEQPSLRFATSIGDALGMLRQ